MDVAEVVGGKDGEVGKVGEQEKDGDKGHGDPDSALEIPLRVTEFAEAEVDVVEAIVLTNCYGMLGEKIQRVRYK